MLSPIHRKLHFNRNVLFLILFALLFSTIGFSCGRLIIGDEAKKGVVTDVIDGDTIQLSDGRIIRYIGIDTPEIESEYTTIECYGEEAKIANDNLVFGKEIELVKGVENKDKYDRYLRYVFVDGIFVNAQLIASGNAYSYSYGKDIKYNQVFTQLENYARLLNRGIWKYCE